MSEIDPRLFKVTGEVEAALEGGHPVVALESTLIAHGMPEPRRLEVARLLEAAVREEGATPATLAIMDGFFRVGLDDEALSRVALDGAEKASTRDLPVAVGLGGTWATTVASTLFIAHRAGIRCFATGGIGGVHREAPTSFDESADLAALARHPVGVVSAGAKAVLDLPKTMERLETLGVPVIGFRTAELPAFYHGKSGLRVSCRVDSPEDCARLLEAQLDRLGGGSVLFVQAPPPAHALDPEVTAALIQAALERARVAGVKGPAVTPYLLAALERASEGDTVETNVALVEANARLAARIARADAERRRRAR